MRLYCLQIALVWVQFLCFHSLLSIVQGIDLLVETNYRNVDDSGPCGECAASSACINAGTSYYLMDQCYNTAAGSSTSFEIVNGTSTELCKNRYRSRDCKNAIGSCSVSEDGTCKFGTQQDVLLDWCVASTEPTGEYTTPMVTQKTSTIEANCAAGFIEALVPVDARLCVNQRGYAETLTAASRTGTSLQQQSKVIFCDNVQKIAMFEGPGCDIDSIVNDLAHEYTDTCASVLPDLYGAADCGSAQFYCKSFANLDGHAYLDSPLTNNQVFPTSAPTLTPTTASSNENRTKDTSSSSVGRNKVPGSITVAATLVVVLAVSF